MNDFLTDATWETLNLAAVWRSLKSFFRWMQQAHYITDNPTLAVSAPSETEPESKELTDLQVKALYAALERRGYSRPRDTALLASLSHGLRAEEASLLNIEDYDGYGLHIRRANKDQPDGCHLIKTLALH